MRTKFGHFVYFLPSFSFFGVDPHSKSKGFCLALPKFLISLIITAMLLAGCQEPPLEEPWDLDPTQVRFEPERIVVPLGENHPLTHLELHEVGGDPRSTLLLTVPLARSQASEVRFSFFWKPGQTFLLRGYTSQDDHYVVPITTPEKRPSPVAARVFFPAGVPLVGGKTPLILPQGSKATLVLRVTHLAESPRRVTIRVFLPPHMKSSLTGRKSLKHRMAFSMEGETREFHLPLQVVGEGKGTLKWDIRGGSLPRRLVGRYNMVSLTPEAFLEGLTLMESRFPATAKGGVMQTRPQETFTFSPPWLENLLHTLDIAAPRNPYVPVSYVRHRIHNALNGEVIALLRTDVRESVDGPGLPGFVDPQKGKNEPDLVLVRVPPKGDALGVQPLFVTGARAGVYQRCVTLLPWGLEQGSQESCMPLKVIQAPLLHWVGLWGSTFGALLVLGLILLRLRHWVAAFTLSDLVLIALFTGAAFLVVAVPGFFLRSVALLALGPFTFLVEGLVFKFLLFLVLGALFSLVRKPGTYFLFYGLWMTAQALLNGHLSPLVFIFWAINVVVMETALWMGGVFRRGELESIRKSIQAALWVSLAEFLVVFWGLGLFKSLYRQHLADWYMFGQAGMEGFYAGAGLLGGLALGRLLNRVRRESITEDKKQDQPGTLDGQPRMGLNPGGALLEVNNLTYAHKGTPILKEVSFTLEAGEILLLGGASGAGKTTLLRLIQGLLPAPALSAIRFSGVPRKAFGAKAWAGRCGLLFQEPELQIVRPTVTGEVAFGVASLPGVSQKNGKGIEQGNEETVKKAVNKALTTLEIEHLKERQTNSLSGGELQRVALASLLAMEPKLLLLDEPLAHLDESARENLVAHLQKLAALGYAILVAEHRTAYFAPLKPRMVWLEDGRAERVAFSETKTGSSIPTPFVRSENAFFEAKKSPAKNTLNSRALSLENLSYSPPNTPEPLWKNLCVRLVGGQAVALKGANGSGKTTLLRLMMGLLKPNQGAVTWAGKPASKLSWETRAKDFGYLPQPGELLLHASSVKEELSMALGWKGHQGDDLKERTAYWLERLDFGEKADLFPHLLSRGQRQRLALATLLAGEPELLLLDEPFAGLDAAGRNDVLNMLETYLNGDPSRRVLLATHDLDGTKGFFDAIWHLEEGTLRVEPVWAEEATA